MSTWPLCVACMQLMFQAEDVLLQYGAWQHMTASTVLPCRDDKLPSGWDEAKLANILAFRDEALLRRKDNDRLKFLRKNIKDEYTLGHDTLYQWLEKRVEKVWRLQVKVLECLETQELGRYDHIHALHVKEVCIS